MPKLGKKKLQKQTTKFLKKNARSPSTSSCESIQPVSQIKIESANIKDQMLLLQKRLDELNSKKNEHFLYEEEEFTPTNSQLYGEFYAEDEMVLLKNRTFCRKKVLEMALGSSTKSSHMARRLLEGVFKNDALIKSTLTGQAPKSLGKERQSQKYDCLDSQARKDITDFAIEYGDKRKWPPQSIYDINRAMTQKLGELKRLHKK